MYGKNEKGFALLIAILLMLLLLALTNSMMFNSRSEAAMTNGVKLSQFYNTAARSAVDRTRANLQDYWVSADPFGGVSDRQQWRFGNLLALAQAGVTGEYGGEMPADAWSNGLTMNGGLIPLTYKVWVKNNSSDPAWSMEGLNFGGVIDPNTWDMDGKVILTVEVFTASDVNNPVATHTAAIGLAGAEFVTLHDDAVREGDIFEAGNLGRGSLGSATEFTLDAYKGGL